MKTKQIAQKGARSCGQNSVQDDMRKRTHAFTLVEMLVALLVAAVILAAMTPVITKRYKDFLRVNVGASSGNSAFLVYDSTNGVQYPTGNALGSLVQKAAGEIEFTNKEGNPVELTLTLQGAGGGGGGYQRTGDLTANSSGTQAVGSTSAATYEWRVPYGVSNVRVTIAGGGGGGGAGNFGNGKGLASAVDNPAEEYCDGYIVIKKYNIGDIPSLLPAGANMANFRDLSSYTATQRGGIASSTTIVASIASGAAMGSVTNTCWYAKNQKTADPCIDAAGYNTCYRTVCTQDAAMAACAALSPVGEWRLPTDAEIQNWRMGGDGTLYQSVGVVTSDAANFCDRDSGSFGAARCNTVYSCHSSAGSGCDPYMFWGSVSTKVSGLQGGKLYGPYDATISYAFSARCVRSTSSCGFTPYHGTGGSGGSVWSNITFPDLREGDRLLFTLGAGGSGAASAGANASNGGETNVVHQRWNGSAWANVSGATTYKAGGGGAGGSATTTAHGAKGTGGTCSQATGCTNGTAANDWNTNSSNSGGASLFGSGAPTTDSTTYNGINASNWSAGGSGGYAKSATEIGKGGNGGAGYALITYNIASTGSGGGAGGYHNDNAKVVVPANTTVTFYIGKGGDGAALDGTGISGTDTKVVQNSTTLYEAKGGLGGTYTPIISYTITEASLAKGGEGGKIYTGGVDKSTAQIITQTSGAKADFVKGGNGGLSKNDDRTPAFGGCSQVDNPLSFSSCTSYAAAASALTPLYDASKKLAKGGAGGGGAGCDDTTCYGGSAGGNGFVTVRW